MPGLQREISRASDDLNGSHVDTASDTTPTHRELDASEKGTAVGPKQSPVAGDKGFEKNGLDRTDIVSVKSGMDSNAGEIHYRTMSWQKASGLLFGEYVCLAILSFPYAFQTLGMVGGILATLILGLVNLYASLNLHAYCLRYPELVNIADIGRHLLGGSKIAYEITALVLVLNNTFLMGLHTLTGAEIINTLAAPSSICSVAASIIIMVVCIIGTLPRKLEQVALMGIVSAITMGISIILVLAFSGAQGRKPAGFDPNEPVYVTAWAPKGTTFVQGFNALLNILFTVGQIVYPTFISESEMKHPEDFPKALYAVTAAEFGLFLTVGIVVYYYAGQYTSAPAVAVLSPKFKKAAFSFVLPTTIIIGIIYAAVVAKYLFVRFFGKTRHFANHTVIGWTGWTLIVVVTWIFGWIIGEAIPFFSTLISLLSALFDGYIGFCLCALAFFKAYKGSLWHGQGPRRKAETAFNVFLVGVGLFVFGVGTYTSVQAIINDYASGAVKAPFTCASNGI
ncbi:unnamed protein product [Parajaminaea phylloscopi]